MGRGGGSFMKFFIKLRYFQKKAGFPKWPQKQDKFDKSSRPSEWLFEIHVTTAKKDIALSGGKIEKREKEKKRKREKEEKKEKKIIILNSCHDCKERHQHCLEAAAPDISHITFHSPLSYSSHSLTARYFYFYFGAVWHKTQVNEYQILPHFNHMEYKRLGCWNMCQYRNIN